MTHNDRLPVCMVGLGTMGGLHLIGFEALERSGNANIEVVAVCDRDPALAAAAADRVAAFSGRRPTIHTSVDEVLAEGRVRALDVITEVSAHESIVVQGLSAGLHVLCEKPIALTMESAANMQNAAAQHNVILATGENFRRHPQYRLAKAVLDAGLLGEVLLFAQTLVGGDDQIIFTPWRHRKESGANGVDMGVHFTDIIQYLMGDIRSMVGHGFIAEEVRFGRNRAGEPIEVQANGEDSFTAIYKMHSGARSVLTYMPAGLGPKHYLSVIQGKNGSLSLPPLAKVFKDATTVRETTLALNGTTYVGDQIAKEVLPSYAPDPIERAIMATAGDGGDLRKQAGTLIGIELYDFARAVAQGRPAEVDGEGGARALGAVLGVYESDLLGREVSMQEVLDLEVYGYQAAITSAERPPGASVTGARRA